MVGMTGSHSGHDVAEADRLVGRCLARPLADGWPADLASLACITSLRHGDGLAR